MEFRSYTIHFKLAEVSDSAFILSLRTDERYNKYLSPVDADLKKQEEWLKSYKIKERKGQEYYFIIERNLDSLPIGTVRLYDFIGNKVSFCWGSWILNENKTRYAALETSLLIYDYAFDVLKFKRCHMDIRKENIDVINYHKKFGVEIVGETELDLIGYYYPEEYHKVRGDIVKKLELYSSIS